MKKTFLSITLGATILLTGGVNATALSVSNPNSEPLKVTILDGNSAFAFHNEMRLTNGGRFTIGDAFFENSPFLREEEFQMWAAHYLITLAHPLR